MHVRALASEDAKAISKGILAKKTILPPRTKKSYVIGEVKVKFFAITVN